MPRSRDILQRFRPAGTPGAASAVGVPADRVAEAAAELEPVLAALADTLAEAHRIREEARREADGRRRRAVDRAELLVSMARSEAAGERADAALRVTAQVQVEGADALADAQRDAAALRRRAGHRMPAYVDRVTAAVRAEMAAREEVAG